MNLGGGNLQWNDFIDQSIFAADICPGAAGDMRDADMHIRINSLAEGEGAFSLSLVNIREQRDDAHPFMREMSERTPSNDAGTGGENLPTRQKNALRLLLAKPRISPEEVAALDYRILERAPGIGKKGMDIIRAWLNSYGHDVSGIPLVTVSQRDVQRTKKVAQAIDYLRGYGYEVSRSR